MVGFNNGLGTFGTGLLEFGKKLETFRLDASGGFEIRVMDMLFKPLTFKTSF